MQNFDWTSFTKRITIKSSVSKIYSAWTKASEIETWFLRSCYFLDPNKYILSKENSISAGCTYEWSWYLYDVVESGKITQANGKDFLQFTFAGDCLVDILLSMKGEDVLVELTQRNIPTDDASKRGIRIGCDSGWSFFLVNLKSFYENGIDLRNKNPEFKGLINN